MFNLEQSIADWRQQMLAAGIQSPEPLEELESHLREEISGQIKSGLNQQKAFDSATQKIGQPGLLKTEFKQVSGFYNFPAKSKILRTNQILGLLWLAFCSYTFVKCFTLPIPTLFTDGKSSLGWFIYFSGTVGGALLIFDSKWGRSLIRMIALFHVALCIIQAYFITAEHSTRLGILAVFSLVSIWLLHLPQQTHREVAK